MSGSDVQTYSYNDTRRKKPSHGQDRRVVFRSVLDNPFQIAWPVLSDDAQREYLSHTMELLVGLSDFFSQRQDVYRRKRKLVHTHKLAKRKKSRLSHQPNPSSSEQPNAAENDSLAAALLDETLPHDVSRPDVLRHLTVGINAVTKCLETHIHSYQRPSSVLCSPSAHASSSSSGRPRAPISVVLVCRSDINPPALVAHLPQLVASYNSLASPLAEGQRRTTEIKLATLPRGAEATLSQIFGLKRVAVLAFDVDMPGIDNLQQKLECVPPIRSHWLQVSLDVPLVPSMEPTHIKQLRTTAPKDMKAAKEERLQCRAEAKKRKTQAKKKGVKKPN